MRRTAVRRAIVLGISLVLCFTFWSRAEPRVAATEPVVDPFTLGVSNASTPASPDSGAASATALWTKYSNPVLSSGPSYWDSASVGMPSVLLMDGSYKMWYAGSSGTKDSGRIGLATSSDGVHWTKSGSTPVLTVGDPGAWDSGYVLAPHVIFHNGIYEMWYRGTDVPETSLGARIGYASSTDGVHWQKYGGNPVLSVGPAGRWDERLIWSAYVIVQGSTYKMWYSACGETNCSIGFATSPDGINWEKDAGNPVLDVGPAGSWDSKIVYFPNVLFNWSDYEMWFSGNYGSPDRIGHATSLDGIHWSEDPSNPVLTVGPAGNWDSGYVNASPVILDGNTYKMWYTGSNWLQDRIGYATLPSQRGSIRGVVWLDGNGNGVRETGEPTIAGASVGLSLGGSQLGLVTTGSDGVYAFESLLPGAYHLQETNPSAVSLSTTPDGIDVALVAGQHVSLDFGDWNGPQRASISGVVWSDGNRNGVRDAGEPTLAGASVGLSMGASQVGLVTTGSNGVYAFESLLPGSYHVQETNPPQAPFYSTPDGIDVALVEGQHASVDFGDWPGLPTWLPLVSRGHQ
jgi:hypothetical protein